MRNHAAHALWIVLLLCTTATAKPPKYKVRCYCYPTYCCHYSITPRYCLQYPLMRDDTAMPPREYFAYDIYNYNNELPPETQGSRPLTRCVEEDFREE